LGASGAAHAADDPLLGHFQAAIGSGICDDPGLNSNYNAEACAAQRKAQAAKELEQLQAATKAQAEADHKAQRLDCTKRPTTLGVLLCRFDTN
jgi:hypothetical protein